MLTKEVWYRFIDTRGYSGPEIVLLEYPVIRHTPKGVWLQTYRGNQWVSKLGHRRYAYPTIELAKNSFEIRKRYQVRHLQNQLSHVQEILGNGEYMSRALEQAFSG